MGILTDPDSYFMQQAIRLAEQALEQDEVPVGAVAGQQRTSSPCTPGGRLHDPDSACRDAGHHGQPAIISGKYLTECTLMSL